MQLEFDFDEQWKPIKGFEGFYDISDKGRYYTYPRKHCKSKYSYGSNGNNGYLCVSLSKNKTQKFRYIHDLVYETFIGAIPKGYDIHHKNHIKTDNRLENLCLMLSSDHRKLHYKKHTTTHKPILQYTADGVFVAEYSSAKKAEKETNICQKCILDCCHNTLHHNTAGGFIWKYKEKNVA